MTILVGIRCQDGVVIGSDSAVTFAHASGSTIEQSTRKIDIFDGSIIVAGTGQVGLGQRFCAQVEALQLGKKLSGIAPTEVGKAMAAAATTDFGQTNTPRGGYGALVAFRTRKELHLCEFATADFQPELKTSDIWFASMGNGQAIADPFLGLMRKVFWKKGMPSLSEGVFAAVWTLSHTIDVNPGGINGPMRLATLTWEPGRIGDKHVARFLDESEVSQHQESVASAERHLASFRDLIGGTRGTAAPDVPLPGAAAA